MIWIRSHTEETEFCDFGNHHFKGQYSKTQDGQGKVNGIRIEGIICSKCENDQIIQVYSDQNSATECEDYTQYGL